MEIKFNPNLDAPVRLSAKQPAPAAPLPGHDRAAFDNLDNLDRSLRQLPVMRPEAVARAQEYVTEDYPPEKTIESLSVLLAMRMQPVPPEAT